MHGQSVTDAPPALASELQSLVRGDVLLPGEEGYDAERRSLNLMVEHNPAVIVVPASPEDVAAAVCFANVAGPLPVAVQATGHGPSVPADGAVLINTRRMTDLEIDPATATARIGPGVKWEMVIERAGPHGLAPLVGSTPDVSAVGYLTGGGLPVLGRRMASLPITCARSSWLPPTDGCVE